MSIYEPGYYVGLTEDEHHAVAALSKSGVKKLLISAAEYWANSPANYEPSERGANRDMLMGSARHCLLLEGKAAFEKRYGYEATKRTHPKALATDDDIRSWLVGKGIVPINGVKAVRIEQALAVDPDVQILDVIAQRHQEANAGKVMLHPEDYENCIRSAEMFDQIRDRLGHGISEVTLVWDDPDLHVRCKARLDWLGLAPGGHGRIIELKDFNMGGRHVSTRKRTADVWAYERHDIDALFELRSVKHTPIKVHGLADPQPKEQFFASVRDGIPEFPPQGHIEMMFLYHRKDGAIPEFIPRTVTMIDSGGTYTDEGQAALTSIMSAAVRYRSCLERFGWEAPWLDDWQVEPIYLEELPAFFHYI
jgi:hypothetical protein